MTSTNKEASIYRLSKPTRQEKLELIYEYGIEKAAQLLGIDEEVLENSVTTKNYSDTLNSTEKRHNSPIKNSKENPLVIELITKNYQYLKDRCVKTDIDEDHFNDVFLTMTYKYNVEDNFNAAFIHQFNIQKMQYQLDKNVSEFSFKSFDECPEAENMFQYELDEPIIETKSKFFSNEFITKLKQNALHKQAPKTEY
jgi:hypothetical protein